MLHSCCWSTVNKTTTVVGQGHKIDMPQILVKNLGWKARQIHEQRYNWAGELHSGCISIFISPFFSVHNHNGFSSLAFHRSARDVPDRNVCALIGYCILRGLYPFSACWTHSAHCAEHLHRIQISQLCLLFLLGNSVQTGSEKYVSIWPEFLDVYQSRRNGISSQKMRQDKKTHMTAVPLPTQTDWMHAPWEDFNLYTSVSITSITNWSPLYQFTLVSENLSPTLLLGCW